MLKRLIIAIPTFLGITLLVFALCYNATGSPLELLLSDPNISEAEVARRAEELGLNEPFYVQYFSWIKNFCCGNLGYSYRTNQAVMGMLMDALWPTVLLTLSAVLVACLISFPLGIQSARHQNGIWDTISSIFSFLSTSNMLLRIYWIKLPINVLPSTQAGIIKCRSNDSKVASFPVSYIPPMGNKPSCTEKILRKTKARKKLGVEVERNEKIEEMVSQMPFWCRAD